MMTRGLVFFRNERGSVLNIALLILLILALAAVFMSRTGTTDVKITGNLKATKARFYEADRGLDIGSELLEQNIACPLGFTASDASGLLIGDIRVPTARLQFSVNPALPPTPHDASRDAYWPDGYGTAAHTNIKIGGQVNFAKGAALQMAAGYEGKGKGAAAGGTDYLFEIYSQRFAESNASESLLWIRWRHLVGMEGPCAY